MKLNLSLLSIFTLNVTSCKKTEDDNVEEVCSGDSFSVFTAYGRVYYDDPALDGCGWYIEIDEEMFKATNFESEYDQYLINNLIVEFDYINSNCMSQCGFIPPNT